MNRLAVTNEFGSMTERKGDAKPQYFIKNMARLHKTTEDHTRPHKAIRGHIRVWPHMTSLYNNVSQKMNNLPPFDVYELHFDSNEHF